ncbi:hypothetical protein J7L68_03045 [bacterium]|nr:hypothetical protein [bacterium]
MKKEIYVIIVVVFLSMLFIGGCCKDCNCPDCSPENNTNIDPPYIIAVDGPVEITVGNTADFSCEVFSDAVIDSFLWDLEPSFDATSDYYYPTAAVAEGEWTPTNERPDIFNTDVADTSASYTYDKRGVYTAVLEIKDTDGYIECGNAIVRVNPETPDTFADIIQLAPGLQDTIYSSEFEALNYGLYASDGCMASVYADSFNVLHSVAYIDSLSGLEDRYIQEWISTGKRLQIFTGEATPADVRVDYDISSAIHLWDSADIDYVQITVYLNIIHENNGRSYLFHLIRQTFTSADGAAYYLDSNHNMNCPFDFNGGFYTLWFGVKVDIYSSQGGAAFCMDNDENLVRLNYIYIDLNK